MELPVEAGYCEGRSCPPPGLPDANDQSTGQAAVPVLTRALHLVVKEVVAVSRSARDNDAYASDQFSQTGRLGSPRLESRRLFADMCVPSALGPGNRERDLRRMADEVFDILVIGGGATGCGAALDAASRGLSVALVEQSDLASGTSSRSSKLVHGGLRYLEQFQFGLVRQALRERELLMTTLAAHLVKPVSFLLPLTANWQRPYLGAGLGLYEALGGTRNSLPRHRHVTKDGALQLAPSLRESAISGGIHFYDGQMDDSRLTIALARTAAEQGAAITTNTAVVALLRSNERIAGAVIVDEETDEIIHVRAKAVLACTGVWTNHIYRLTGQPGPSPLPVRASRGVHLVVDGDAISSQAGLITRTPDSVLFVIPWRGHWLVGTTDTAWDDPSREPDVTSQDVAYLLGQINQVLSTPIRPEQILSVFAGLRPLVDTASHGCDQSRNGSSRPSTSRLSREFVVEQLAPGLTAIAGGKWTTYRLMAQAGVEAALRPVMGVQLPESRTASLVLSGSRAWTTALRDASSLAAELGLGPEVGERLALRYGAHAFEILDLVRQQPELALPVADTPATIAAEVVYACRFDAALHVADVIDRRLRLSMTGPVSEATQLDVAAHMAKALGWDNARTDQELATYAEIVQGQIATLTRVAQVSSAQPEGPTSERDDELVQVVLGG